MRNIGKVVRRRLAPLLADRRQPGKGAGPTGARIRGARQLSHPKLGVSRSLRNWAISEVLETVALSADHMGEARAVVSIAYYLDVELSARGERERGARHFASSLLPHDVASRNLPWTPVGHQELLVDSSFITKGTFA